MKSKQLIHQALLNEWGSRISEQKASGLTVREWCEQNDLSIHKYNYWKHQLKEELLSQVMPDIAPLPCPAGAPLTVPDDSDRANRAIRTIPTAPPVVPDAVDFLVNGISVRISADFLPAFIEAICHA